MNKFAVLAEGFENLSYPLGNTNSEHGQKIDFQRGNYALFGVESEQHAQMLVGSYDWLSEHAAAPIGYVANKENSLFVVCHLSPSLQPDASKMDDGERLEFCRAVIKRLASLHTQGFGCGGIRAESVDFSGKKARLTNPAEIFALTDSDSVFYEAVATLRSLAGSGFAGKNSLERLAAAYVSHSPVCRHAIAEKSGKASPGKFLAAHAKRMAAYF